MPDPTWAVVVPTNRPAMYQDFLKAWRPLFDKHDAHVIPVFDEPPWEGIPDFIPKRTDMIRSWGMYLAWREGFDYILSLDDDVRPSPYHDPFDEYEAGFDEFWPCAPYLSVGSLTSTGLEMRGFPYENREARAMVQYGGWIGVPDLDGKTQLAWEPQNAGFADLILPVPRGSAVTTCAMNMAWRRDFTPCMWQLPVLDVPHQWGAEAPDMDSRKCRVCGFVETNAEQARRDYHGVDSQPCSSRYKRWGDIWSGLIQKRVLDARGEVMLVNGRASVLHERASDPVKNAEIEASGMGLNEVLWDALAHEGGDYQQLTDAVAALAGGDYGKHLRACRDKWLDLFA